MQNTYEYDFSELPSYLASYAAILKWKKNKKLPFQTTHKHIFHLSK